MQILFNEEVVDVDSNTNSIDNMSTFYNDNDAKYVTTLNKSSIPRYEEIQIRFNNILQKRDQLQENLSGSQIVFLLDFYIEQAFNLPLLIIDTDKDFCNTLTTIITNEYEVVIKDLVHNRRKLFSIRFQNTDILDTLLELLYEKNYEVFKNKFLSIKLNRDVYLKFLYNIFNHPALTKHLGPIMNYYEFYNNQYINIKNLLLGNYIRYAFAETNKFFAYNNCEHLSLETKEDYFSGLMLVILKVIDKYDAFKGTLTSFIENWLKDYRTTFKAKQTLVMKAIALDTDDNYLNECIPDLYTPEDTLNDNLDFKAQLVEALILNTNRSLQDLKDLCIKHPAIFPTLKNLLVS